MSKYEVSTLKKGLQILDLLQEEQFLTLTEITKALNLNKTTAFRLLSTLGEYELYYKKRQVFYYGMMKSFEWIESNNPLIGLRYKHLTNWELVQQKVCILGCWKELTW